MKTKTPAVEHGGLGAQSRNRTSDTRIFSPLLYRLSYLGKEVPVLGPALLATQKGLEPSTSSVTGWHSNQLNYCANPLYQAAVSVYQMGQALVNQCEYSLK